MTITLPSGKGQKLAIQDAIGPMRELIRSTNKAVRITGLSGVGKTRIVQALFDESVGADALIVLLQFMLILEKAQNPLQQQCWID